MHNKSEFRDNNTHSLIFINISDEFVCDRKFMEKSLKDVVDKGFHAAYFQIRDTVYDALDNEMVKTVYDAVNYARKLGLKVWINLAPDSTLCYQGYAKRWPNSQQYFVTWYKVKVNEGNFRCEIDLTGLNRYTGKFIGIETCFLLHKNSRGQILNAEHASFTYRWNNEPTMRGTMSINKMESRFVPVIIEGRLKKNVTGEILIYPKFLASIAHFPRFFDYASNLPYKLADEISKTYKNIKIEGMGWDEPGVSCIWRQRKCHGGLSNDFYKKFHKKNGYDLKEKLFALDINTLEDNCGKIRYDYYKLLADLLYDISDYTKKKYRKVFGKDMIMGIHQTLHETTYDDIFHGSIDIFNLAKVFSGGFTDSVFNREDNMIWSIVMANSLSKITESGKGYNNSWSFKPTEREIDYFTRIMCLNNVNWIAHMYGETYEFGPGYPNHWTWNNMARYTNRLNKFLDFSDNFQTKSDIAIVYSWEGLADFGDYDYMHLKRAGEMILIKKLFINNFYTDFINTDMLKKNSRYKCIIFPWPIMMSERDFKELNDFACKGGKVIFYGLPCHQTFDCKDISGLFGGLLGIKPVNLYDYREFKNNSHIIMNNKKYLFKPKSLEPNYYTQPDDYHPVPRFYPLKPIKGGCLAYTGENCIGVNKGNIYYFSFELPLFGNMLEDLLKEINIMPSVKLPSNVIAREMYNSSSSENILALTGRWDKNLPDKLKLFDSTINLKNIKIAGIKHKNKKITEILTEDKNGKGGEIYITN